MVDFEGGNFVTEEKTDDKAEDIVRVVLISFVIIMIGLMLNINNEENEYLTELPEDTLSLMEDICNWSTDLESLVTTYLYLPHSNEIAFVTKNSIVHIWIWIVEK